MSQPRILIVEDNPLTRKMLARTLESEGWRVDEAATGARALAAAADSAPDLVLQDLVLPDMDGLYLASNLRMLPGMAEIPLVVLSGFTSRFAEASSHPAGIAAVLLKPIESNDLIQRLRPLLPRWDRTSMVATAALSVVVAASTVAAARMLERDLRRLGLDVEAIVGGHAALARAARLPAAVVVTELALPDLDGMSVCVAAAGMSPRRPVVVLVGDDADEDTLKGCGMAGATAVLRWPSGAATLVHTLRTVSDPARPQPAPLSDLRADVLRRELVRERERSRTLLLRTRLHEARIALLAGIANAVTRGDDEQTALRDVLAACLDVAAASKGALYLRDPDGRVVCRAALGYPEASAADVGDFFGQRALFDAALVAGFPVSFVPEQDGDRELLGAAGVHTARLIPLTREAEPIGAIFLGADADDEGIDDAVTFARALGNHVVLSQALHESFRRVAASEAYHRTLTEHASCGVVTLDSGGCIVSVNPAARQMFGSPHRGASLRNQVREGHRDELDAVLMPAPGASVTVEVVAPRPDGRDRVLELTGTVVEAAGEQLVLVIANDVSDRKRILQQLAFQDKLATVGTLAAGIAHEINNPMTFVLNDLELIETRLRGSGAALPEVIRECLQLAVEAHQGADRIRELVGALKGFTRVDSGDLAPVDVNQLLDDAVHMAGGALRQRATIVRAYGEVPPISASSGRLLQVFTNLLVNAAQAIPDGAGERNRVTVTTRLGAKGLVVEVTDTGSGIAPEDLGRIFEPFFTTKPAGVGTGLGLSICHEIVHNHGGSLEVASQVGQGTTFTVTLPLTPSQLQLPDPAPPVAPRVVARARILVVDDEALLLRMLSRALASRHDVVTALGGAMALEILARDGETFDLIVTDLCMPDIDGISLEAAVATQVPALAKRIVFMTGGAITSEARDFVAQRTDRMIQKPFTISALSELIDTTLRAGLRS